VAFAKFINRYNNYSKKIKWSTFLWPSSHCWQPPPRPLFWNRRALVMTFGVRPLMQVLTRPPTWRIARKLIKN